jgi:1-deoxy-D-xylulose-5-phosphate synthase
MHLKDIKAPSDIKHLKPKELKALACEIRAFLAESIPKTGGHLSPNLGIVELTIALHYVFDSPKDGIIFDVGHQAYTHKILTGRLNQFDTLRQTDGLSGYINYKESIHDIWESGHAGSSLSALVGYIYAKKLKGEQGHGVAVIGDASITNGMAFEALNLLGSERDKRGIIILNDNKMSISKSVGAVSRTLARIRSMALFIKIKRFWEAVLPKFMLNFLSYIKRGVRSFFQTNNIFEDLGYMYLGPIDGHNIKSMIHLFERVKRLKKSVVIHVLTKKGMGHKDAQDDVIGNFHGVSKKEASIPGISWSLLVAKIIEQIQEKERTFVVMPAMTVGAQFIDFVKKYPDRFVDVGIAEEHAATMAASLAHQGIKVFLPLYSTFSQRAFDQILNDIARPNHHVVIGIDRAGIVGEDGATHQGLFDVSMFHLMPNMKIAMPYDDKDAAGIFAYAFFGQSNPMAIRYPRGKTCFDIEQDALSLDIIKPSWTYLDKGNHLAFISYGPSLDLLLSVKKSLNLDCDVINARFIKPMDLNVLNEVLSAGKKLFVYEEGSDSGSLYPQILKHMAKHNYKNDIRSMSITDQVVEHGHYEDVLKKTHMDQQAVINALKGWV